MLITYAYFLKYIFGDILIVHPDPSSLLLETIAKKFGGAEWSRADIWGQGPSTGKTSTPCLVVHFAMAYYVETNMEM